MMKNIISLLLLGVAVLVFGMWVRPALDELDELRFHQSLLEQALEETRELQGIRDELLAKYNSISAEDLARISRVIPENPGMTKLAIAFDDIGSDKGVLVKKFDTVETKQEQKIASKDYKINNFEAELSASYAGFRVFIDELQRSLRLIDVDEIEFSSEKDDFYNIIIKLESYSHNE